MAILGKPAAGTFSFNPAAWGANATPAPDSYYNVDEGTGTALTNIGKDAGSYNGTISGAAWGTESSSPILSFDGVDDFVSFGSAFGITAFPCTIALVCRTLSDFSVFKCAFALANAAAANVNHAICITSLERIQIRTQNTTLFTSGAASGNLFDGSYHVLVMVLASATSKIGYHGAAITSPAITDNVAIGTLTAARLGSFADSSPSDWANIAVASAMVWKDAALSAAQIQTDLVGNPFGFLVPNVTGTAAAIRTAATAAATGTQTFTGTAGAALSSLAGASVGGQAYLFASMLRLFRANEGSGNTLDDLTPNDLDGTADGTLVWVSDPDLGTVPDLGGTVQIDCGDVAGADGAVLTVAGWVKFDDLGQADCVISKYNTTGNQRSWNIGRQTDGDMQFQISGNGTANEIVTVALGFNTAGPYHFIVEYNAGAVAIWLNNVAQTVVGTFTITSLFAGTASLYIGGLNAGGDTQPTDMRFKDMVLWNRVITAPERQKAYDGEFGDFSIDADLAIGMSLASSLEFLPPGFTGTAGAILGQVAGSAAGGQAFTAAAQAAMSAVTAAGQGELLFTGTSAANLAAMSATAAADQAFQAAASALLGTISGEAVGDVEDAAVTGVAAAVLAVVTSEAFAALDFSGTAETSLAALTSAALAEQVFTGTASAEASGLLASGTGGLSFAAAVSALLQPLESAGEGSVGDYATADAVLQALTAEAVGGQTFEGAGIAALATLQGAAAGGMDLSGAAAALLAATTALATGTFGFSGEATANLAALVAEVLAQQVLAAQGAGELQALEANASGGLGFTAEAAALLAALTAEGSAALGYTGTVSATLQALTALGAQIRVPFVIPGRVFQALPAQRTAYALSQNRTFRAPATNRTFTVN